MFRGGAPLWGVAGGGGGTELVAFQLILLDRWTDAMCSSGFVKGVALVV